MIPKARIAAFFFVSAFTPISFACRLCLSFPILGSLLIEKACAGNLETAETIAEYINFGLLLDQKAVRLLAVLSVAPTRLGYPFLDLMITCLLQESGDLDESLYQDLDPWHWDLFLQLVAADPQGTQRSLLQLMKREGYQLPGWAGGLILLLLSERNLLL